MKIKKTILVIKTLALIPVALFGFLSQGYSQQQTSFTQYMFNSLVLNPAYAGYSGGGESLELNVLAREQWLGMNGSPSTQTLSAHSPIRKTNMGIGLQVIHDKIGANREVGSYFSYAYHIPLSKKRFNGKSFKGGSALALGLQAGVSYFSNDFGNLSIVTQAGGDIDPSFSANDANIVLFNFGAGAFYYSERLYVGFSVPYILNNSYGAGSKQATHMFLTGGYLFDLSPSLRLKPSFLVKSVSGAPIQLDLNANLLIKNLLWLGVSWRSLAAVSVIVEYHISNRIRVGYAYDINTTALAQAVGGAHEFRLNYRIPLSGIKIINPRCF